MFSQEVCEFDPVLFLAPNVMTKVVCNMFEGERIGTFIKLIDGLIAHKRRGPHSVVFSRKKKNGGMRFFAGDS